MSNAGYNRKRSAVQHLVRCHFGHLWDGEFEQKIKVLWPELANKNNESSDSKSEAEDEDTDDRNFFQEGKSPMTPEFYESLCQWFMVWGNVEGIFATCFLVFT